MRKLRKFYTDAEIGKIYAEQYDHTQWPEHVARVMWTISTAQALIDEHHLTTVTDLSCGDGAIVDGLKNVGHVVKHDMSKDGFTLESRLPDMDYTGLFICSETIEHLKAPWTVLEQIREKTDWLVLSTPLDEEYPSENWEHYWSFSVQDVADILEQAGFKDGNYTRLSHTGWRYTYQIWTAQSGL